MQWHNEKKLRSIARSFFFLLIIQLASCSSDKSSPTNRDDQSKTLSPVEYLKKRLPLYQLDELSPQISGDKSIRKGDSNKDVISCEILNLIHQLPDSTVRHSICIDLNATFFPMEDSTYCLAIFPVHKEEPSFKIAHLNRKIDRYLSQDDLHELANFHWTSFDWAYAFKRMENKITKEQKEQLQQYCRFESSDQSCLRDMAKSFFVKKGT